MVALDWTGVLHSFMLIIGAEFGDKSQLVCMALAVRYRLASVALGAMLAFVILNALAVTVGVAVAHWLPEWLVLSIVASLFAVFGVLILRDNDVGAAEAADVRSGAWIWLSVAGLILMAELGDKTQLAMVGLAGVHSGFAVWLGGTAALLVTTLSGIWAGRWLLRYLPMQRIQQAGGVLFLLFAGWSCWQSLRLLLS